MPAKAAPPAMSFSASRLCMTSPRSPVSAARHAAGSVLVDLELDPPVLCAALFRGVGRDRARLAVAGGVNARRAHALVGEIVDHRLRPLLGERMVVAVAA